MKKILPKKTLCQTYYNENTVVQLVLTEASSGGLLLHIASH